MALFAGHIVDQNEKKRLFVLAKFAFLIISFGFYFVTSEYFYSFFSSKQVLYTIYFLVFVGGFVRAFFGPIIFSLVALIVPKKIYPNAASWSSSTWQLAAVVGPAFAGFSIAWIGVNYSMGFVLSAIFIALVLTFFIKKEAYLKSQNRRANNAKFESWSIFCL